MCNCNCKYSNFSIFGICLDEKCKIERECKALYPDDAQEASDCTVREVAQYGQQTGQQATFNAQPLIDKLLNSSGLFHTPNATTTTAPVTPPPTNLILGMQPAVAVTVGIGVLGLVTWGIVALVKK